MSNALAIGIDLGTSTSEIAFFHDGRPEAIRDSETMAPIVPSLVALDQRGGLLVGGTALAWIDHPGSGAREVKRKMGTGEAIALGGTAYRPEELSACILAKLKRNAEDVLGQPVTEVVLSVPANFNDAAKQATLHASGLAGLTVIQLVNEPTAAALAYGIEHIDVEAQLVVFDFGGGTLDVSTLEMMEGVLDVKSSYGDPQLGGKDFDEALMALVLRKFHADYPAAIISEKSLNHFKSAAEAAKIELSSQEKTMIRLSNFASVAGDLVDLDVITSRAEFEAEVAPLIERARACLLRAMKAAKYRPSAVDTVLLVGGTTYIPCVRALVQEFFGRPVRTEVDPDLAVALGAATLAGMKKGHVDPRHSLIFTDVCPMGVGIEVVTEIGGHEVLTYEALITPNTPLPFEKPYEFTLRYVDQDAVIFHVYQTHQQTDLLPLELGLAEGLLEEVGLEGNIPNIPPSQTGDPRPIHVHFSYDDNGVVKIRAVIPEVELDTEITFQQSRYRMSEAELQEAKARVSALLATARLAVAPSPPAPAVAARWMEHPLAGQYRPLMTRAEKLMAEHPGHAGQLTEAVSGLQQALAGGDEGGIEAAGDRLTDLLFDIQG